MYARRHNCRKAQDNLAVAIDRLQRLPQNAFRTGWGDFHFFDSDRMFDRAFIGAVQAMLGRDHTSCACIVNLDREKADPEAIFVIARETSIEEYESQLAGAGPGDGWIYRFDRFGCASENESWCIYCERTSELAVIGFREKSIWQEYEEVLNSLYACRVDSIISGETKYDFPSHTISPMWQAMILQNFGTRL